MKDVDVMYVEYGNTFYLRYQMHASGADPIIKRKVAEGVMYIGASASSICAGQTASIGFWKGWDDPGFGESWDLRWGRDGLSFIAPA